MLDTKSLCKFYVDHFWLLIVLAGLVSMVLSIKSIGGVRSWEIAALVAFPAIRTIKIKPIDMLVILYIFYSSSTYLWSNVAFDEYLNGGIKSQLLPMAFYFIARSPLYKNNAMLYNMRIPLLFAFISALLLYFWQPSWYMEFRTKDMEIGNSSHSWFEHTRLSGFWGWSYVLGYAALFYIMFELKRKFIDKENVQNFLFSMIVAFLVLFFAQQRVSIAYSLLFLVLLMFVVSKNKVNFVKSLTILMLGVGVLAVGIYIIISNYMDPKFLEYVLNRSVESDSNIVADRFSMFDSHITSIPLFGKGLGSYSHYVISKLGKEGISDCDYIRLPNEIGLVGFFNLTLIIVGILIMGIKNVRKNFFEVNVVLFLLCSMIGAAPLEAWTLHPFMYWYCMGRIVSNNYSKKMYNGQYVEG